VNVILWTVGKVGNIGQVGNIAIGTAIRLGSVWELETIALGIDLGLFVPYKGTAVSARTILLALALSSSIVPEHALKRCD
jgi:hypothetical protein